MARKKKSRTRPPVVKFILVTLLVVGIGFAVGLGITRLLRQTDYFRVQSVILDSSLQFINKRDLRGLIGENIFNVNIKALHRRLSFKYPQASHLKVVRHFPNQIAITAKERLPFMQVKTGGKLITLDEESVVLSQDEKRDNDLPLVVGANVTNARLVRGWPLKGTDIQTALEIAKDLQAETRLSSYSLTEVNVENLSKIYLTLSGNLEIILDRSNIAHKIKVLGVVLAQSSLDLKEVHYIDLRFKEPIIGKK